jgi:hypothetical protein
LKIKKVKKGGSMGALNRRIALIVLFIVLSFTFAGRVFAQVGFPNFRVGDILYCPDSVTGHVGILFKDGVNWMVREAYPLKVRSVSFCYFYGRDATKGCRIKLLKVNCSDSVASLAANRAETLKGLWSLLPIMPLSYSCSSLVWKAYDSVGIDLRNPHDPKDPNDINPFEIFLSPKTTDIGQIMIGDLTRNNFVNINDVQACVNHILGLQYLSTSMMSRPV